MADEDHGLPVKLLLSGIVITLMIPGLIFEPGPLSEIAGLGALGAIWGLDLGGDS